VNLLDFIGLGAAGGDDLDLRAFGLADQRARQRRRNGNPAGFGVGFRFADDLPHLLLVGVLIDQRDRRAEFDGFARKLGDIDHVGARKLVLKLRDAALVQRLLLLGGVILGILRQVTVRARFGDLLNDAGPLDGLAMLELVF